MGVVVVVVCVCVCVCGGSGDGGGGGGDDLIRFESERRSGGGRVMEGVVVGWFVEWLCGILCVCVGVIK